MGRKSQGPGRKEDPEQAQLLMKSVQTGGFCFGCWCKIHPSQTLQTRLASFARPPAAVLTVSPCISLHTDPHGPEKLQDASKSSEPKAGVWPSAAEDGRRLAAALDALGALDAQAGNLHRGEKYRAHGSTKLSAPGRAGLAGSDARLPANEMTRTSLGPSGAISVRSDQASRVG